MIASAHGGRLNGSKDTIGNLPRAEPVLGNDVRVQALAATLRIADELADDSSRAGRFMLEAGQIPRSSEVYHRYAKALQSVIVRSERREIELDFHFNQEDAMTEFGKDHASAYLLDEIYSRTVKMHCERMYCMRFMSDIARLDAINVTIKVYKDSHSPFPMIDPIGYSLAERGYPTFAAKRIKDLCPEVTFTGASLMTQLLKQV